MIKELMRVFKDEIIAPIIGIVIGGLFLYAVYKNWDSILVFVEKTF